MKAMSKVVMLLAISAALTWSCSDVFAKSNGGDPGQVRPVPVHASGTSAPSGAGGNRSKYVPYSPANCTLAGEGVPPRPTSRRAVDRIGVRTAS
jgi:hypothetical protein